MGSESLCVLKCRVLKVALDRSGGEQDRLVLPIGRLPISAKFGQFGQFGHATFQGTDRGFLFVLGRRLGLVKHRRCNCELNIIAASLMVLIG